MLRKKLDIAGCRIYVRAIGDDLTTWTWKNGKILCDANIIDNDIMVSNTHDTLVETTCYIKLSRSR